MLRLRRARCCAVALLLGLVWGVTGCSKKTGVTDPPLPPLEPGDVVVSGNVVQWATSAPSRGSVRYGYTKSRFDHMAYPASGGRRDRQLRTHHDVPLLDLEPGRMLYFQTLSEAPGVPRAFTALDSFLVAGALGRAVLTSTMIHVGQGDSHLITMPNGNRMLIDAGERANANSVMQYFEAHGVGSVVAMQATHVHVDHIGGLVGDSGGANGLLHTATPRYFFDSPNKSGRRGAYFEALEAIAAEGIEAVVLERGQTSDMVPQLNLDPDVRITVLNSGRLPAPPFGFGENDQINNDSIVLKFSYGVVDFIIGGDAEKEAEASMLAAFPAEQLDVEYYKVHHHGLDDGTSVAWLNALQPRVAFIPNTARGWEGNFEARIFSTSGKLAAVGAHLYVIDEAESMGHLRGRTQYNVTFATDGVSYEVRIEIATQTVPLKPAQPACLIP